MDPQVYSPQPDPAASLFALLPWLILIGCAIWVYVDAKSIGARKGLTPGFLDLGPVAWSLATLLLWLLAFPLYLAHRGKIKDAAARESTRHVYGQAAYQTGWANPGWQAQGWPQNPPPVMPPANWYDDPDHPGYKRWWDGHQWTEHRVHKPY